MLSCYLRLKMFPEYNFVLHDILPKLRLQLCFVCSEEAAYMSFKLRVR